MYQTAVDGSMVVGLNKVQDYVNGKLSKEELEQYSKRIAADPAGVTTGTAFLDPVRTTTVLQNLQGMRRHKPLPLVH